VSLSEKLFSIGAGYFSYMGQKAHRNTSIRRNRRNKETKKVSRNFFVGE